LKKIRLPKAKSKKKTNRNALSDKHRSKQCAQTSIDEQLAENYVETSIEQIRLQQDPKAAQQKKSSSKQTHTKKNQ